MAFQPATYEEAKSRFKPLQRSKGMRGPRPATKVSGRRRIVRKKAKRVKTSTLKKKAWTEFSIFIRTRGADEHGMATCCTCGCRKHWKEMQAGHFIRGRLNGNLFDERGVWPQCYSCNVGRQGNVVEYYEWMLANHGPEVIADLKRQNSQTKKWAPGELEELFQKYRSLNATNPLLKVA